MNITKLLILTLSIIVCVANSARILCIFPIAIIKELEVYQTIWIELATRGHQVTVIAPNVLQNRKHDNITLILTTQTALDPQGPTPILSRKISSFKDYYTHTYKDDLTLMEKQMAFPQVKNLIADKQAEFDLVLVDVRAPAFFAFAARFNCPLVGYSPFPPLPHIHNIIGSPVHPIADSDACPSSHESTFGERLGCVYLDLWIRYFYNSVAMRLHNSLAKKYVGSDIPYVGAIEKNMSLMFITTNLFLRKPRPNGLSVIDVDRLHIKKKNPLPKDLQTLLDASKEGVIYVNLGPAIDDDLAQFLMSTFAEVPLKFLWQFKEVNKLTPAKNVLIKKYLPQQDLLGHPNIKACVLEGDIQSIEEAIVNRVPVIAVPFSADQIMNVKRVQEEGFGLAVGLELEDRRSFGNKLAEIANLPMYKSRINEVAGILEDESMNSLDKIVWWVEYVARNEDISHLKVPSKDMPWIKYLLLDVIGVVLLSIVLLLLLSFLALTYCVKRIYSALTGKRLGGNKQIKKSV